MGIYVDVRNFISYEFERTDLDEAEYIDKSIRVVSNIIDIYKIKDIDGNRIKLSDVKNNPVY